MKTLLIDDVRLPEYINNPETEDERYRSEDVQIARSPEEGIVFLRSHTYETLLLDHDMGYGSSGMDVIKFLDENPEFMPPKIYLVTGNIIAGSLMVEYLQRWFKDGQILSYRWIR